MNAKSFLFVSAWIKPLKTLPLEQRWTVMEAIAEYATTGQLSMELDSMETIAFLFIRNEIDRMKNYRAEQLDRKRARRQEKANEAPKLPKETNQASSTDANNAKYANACNPIQEYTPFDIISVSESVSESKTESVKKSSSTTCARECEGSECRPNLVVRRKSLSQLRTDISPQKNSFGYAVFWPGADLTAQNLQKPLRKDGATLSVGRMLRIRPHPTNGN